MVFTFNSVNAQAFNDNPCQAIALIPGNSCEWQEFNNFGATNIHSLAPPPGCGGYNATETQDVWFVVEVPASGRLKIDQLEGTLTNTSMAVYTASSCAGPFTRIACDFNSSPNGSMPLINLSGLVPGSLIFIRVWDFYINNVNPAEEGTFSICVENIGSVFDGSNSGGPTVTYDCNSTPPAGNTCDLATPICSFDGYCGSTSGYSANFWYSGNSGLGGPLTAQGIFCGSIENNSFVSFVATSTSVQLDVDVWGSSCYDGIQFMMFGDPTGAPACGSYNIESYGCLYDEMPPGVNSFTASGLTPGYTYYLMIDGFGGDVCDYQINAISGV